MSDLVILAGSILGGAVAATITVWGANRKLPSRVTTDSVTLVDASGKVISNLTAEIHRLETKMAQVQDEAATAQAQAQDCARRVGRLEQALMAAGVDPLTIT